MRGVDYVIHAAAMKHVPASEYNPFECVQTNIYGAENIVKAAADRCQEGVDCRLTRRNPINLYGATNGLGQDIYC